MELFIQLIGISILLVIGYFVGQDFEKKHYKKMEERDRKLGHLKLNNLKKVEIDQAKIQSSELVQGSVVVSVDYFKRFIAGFRLLIGGRLTTYESLLDRAKREAVLRMKEQAASSDMIINVRVETSSISRGHQGNRGINIGSVEVLAFGTAIKLNS